MKFPKFGVSKSQRCVTDIGFHLLLKQGFFLVSSSATVLLGLAAMSLLSSEVMAQQTTASGTSTFQSSLNAMVGQTSVQDATLAGNAQVIAGASNETDPIILRALASPCSRLDIAMSSGNWTDIRTTTSSIPTGSWTNGDGTQHVIAQHNQLTDSAWFFPPFVLQRLISDPTLTTAFIAQEGSLLHFQSYRLNSDSNSTQATFLQHLTTVDMYLDANTLLPIQMAFNIHPDSDASIDIPILIQYDNYQLTNGVSLPLHVQRYVNNSLALDIQLQSATFNSGLTQSTLTAQ